jgi:hypothetical protein
LLKIGAKNVIYKWSHGGVKNDQKSSIIDLGDPDPPVYKFFEISSLFAKAPPLFDPKIDPYKWPIENVIPHK